MCNHVGQRIGMLGLLRWINEVENDGDADKDDDGDDDDDDA